jgi:hypothetical protein
MGNGSKRRLGECDSLAEIPGDKDISLIRPHSGVRLDVLRKFFSSRDCKSDSR